MSPVESFGAGDALTVDLMGVWGEREADRCATCPDGSWFLYYSCAAVCKDRPAAW